MKARFAFAHMAWSEVLALTQQATPGPTNTDDLRAWWEAGQRAVRERRVTWDGATSEALPGGHEEYVAKLRALPIAAVMGERQWDVRMVTLPSLISMSMAVFEERIQLPESLRTPSDDLGELLRFCLMEPTKHRVAVQVQPDNSVILSSEDPNLRVMGQASADTPQGKVFGFITAHGLPWIQVTVWRGRHVLRDGHHRAMGLLRAGYGRIPVAFVDQAAERDVGFKSGLFTADVVGGPQPPVLGDFLDDRLAREIDVPRMRKVVRISAAEFGVPVDAPTGEAPS